MEFKKWTHILKELRNIEEKKHDSLGLLRKFMEILKQNLKIDEAFYMIIQNKTIMFEMSTSGKPITWSEFSIDDFLNMPISFIKTIDSNGSFYYLLRLDTDAYMVLATSTKQDAKVHFIGEMTLLATKIYKSALKEKGRSDFNFLLESTKNFTRTIIDSFPDMIAFKDTNHVYRLVNKAASEFYQKEHGSLEGKTIDEVYPEEVAAYVKSLDDEAVKKGGLVQKKIQMLSSDGFNLVDSTRTPVYDDEERLLGIITISRDISENEKQRKKIEELQNFHNLLGRLASKYINVNYGAEDDTINEFLETIGNATDSDRSYIFLYHFNQNIIEYKYEWVKQGISEEIDNFKYMPLADFYEEWLDKHIRGEKVHIEDVSRLSSESIVRQTLEPQAIKSIITVPLIHDSEVIGFLGLDDTQSNRSWSEREDKILNFSADILTNLLVKKKHNVLFNQSQLYLKQSNQFKTKFLKELGHELKNPLNGLSNALYLLRNSDSYQDQEEALVIAEKSLLTVNNLLTDSMQVMNENKSSLEIKYAYEDLEEVVSSALMTQRAFATNKGLKIWLEYDYSINHQLYFDSEKLSRVLLNLVSNSIKYTKFGEIIVSVSLKEDSREHSVIAFSVTDSGYGLSQDEVDKILEPYYRGYMVKDLNIDGEGIGLSIVKEILDLFKAELKVESSLGKGSTFSFELHLKKDKKTLKYFEKEEIYALVVSEDGCYDQRIFHQTTKFLKAMNISLQIVTVDELHQVVHKKEPTLTVIFERCYRTELKEKKPRLLKHLAKHDPQTLIVLRKDTDSSHDIIMNSAEFHISIDSLTPRKTFVEMFNQCASSKLTESATSSQQKVMLVEDDAINRSTLQKILERHQFSVSVYETAEEALVALHEEVPQHILTDINLPNMSGITFGEKVRKLYPNERLNLFAITAYNDFIMQNKNSEIFDKVYQKPVDIGLVISDLKNFKNTKLIDFNYLIDRFDYQYDVLVHTLESFNTAGFKQLHELKLFVDENNVNKIKSSAHTFKGTCLLIGAKDAASICQELIDYCDDYKGEAKVLYHRLEVECLNLKKTIETELPKLRKEVS